MESKGRVLATSLINASPSWKSKLCTLSQDHGCEPSGTPLENTGKETVT